MTKFFIWPTFISLEICLDGLLVNATCVLHLKPLLRQEGEQRTKGLCKPEQPGLWSQQLPAAMGMWEERLVSNCWLEALREEIEMGMPENGITSRRGILLQEGSKSHCMGIERRSWGLRARRLNFIKEQVPETVTESGIRAGVGNKKSLFPGLLTPYLWGALFTQLCLSWQSMIVVRSTDLHIL